MQEGDAPSARSGPDARIEDPESRGFRPFERGIEILHLQADVVHALAAPLEEARDGGFRAGGLEQLDAACARAEEGHADAFGGNIFLPSAVTSEQGGEGRNGFCEGIDRDSDVVDLVHGVNLDLHAKFIHPPWIEEQYIMANEHVLEFTDETFGTEVEGGEGLAIVDFWAEWCGPCHAVAPAIESLAEEYAGKVKIGKLDVDSNRRVTEKFNVRSIPSILYFKDGELVETVIGVRSKGQLEELIKAHA